MQRLLQVGLVYSFFFTIINVSNMGSWTYAVPLLTVDGTSSAVGFNHICAIETGSFRPVCSGKSEFGKLEAPTGVEFAQLVAGTYFTCGLALEQTVFCWGDIQPSAPEGLFTQISAGSYYACGILIDGSLSCWGQSGVVAAVAHSMRPARGAADREDVLGGQDSEYAQVSCAPELCCALDVEGRLHCWGTSGAIAPDFRVLGNISQTSEAQSAGTESATGAGVADWRFSQVSIGGDGAACGVTHPTRDLVCWGRVAKHGLAPVVPGPFAQVSVSSGRLGVCALRADGSAVCWGQAAALAGFVRGALWDQLEVGASALCAVSRESAFRCGGGNGINMGNFSSGFRIA